VTSGSHSRRQVTAITGLSCRQISYWRRTGLIVPQGCTAGGHARYSFSDLIALRTAKRLLDARISLQRVRKCLRSLTRYLPNSDRPLAELSLVVTGDAVLVFHGERAFDALSGQEWVFSIAELAAEVEKMQRQPPLRGDLFSAHDNRAGEG
jgi:DNA-binding transcriptional MerR regulator